MIKSTSSIVLLALLLFSKTSFAQEPMDPLLEKLNNYMNEKHIPGMMISIVTKDSILYSGGLGFANIETKERVNASHLFRVGSLSKPFTALGIYKLYGQDVIQLSQPIKQIDPGIPFVNPWEAESPVTVESLLEHTSGFEDFHLNAVYNFKDSVAPATIELVKSHANSLKSRWRPGTRKAYSNSGYVVAGHIIEKVSNMPYHKFLKENILSPIGMEKTGYYFKRPKNIKVVQGYNYRGGKYVSVPFYSIQGGPAGGLCSNANDMAEYLKFMLNRDGGKLDSLIFTKKAFDRIENSKVSISAKAGLKGGYGLGNYSIWKNGYRFYGHSGGIDGFASRFMYSRDANFGIVISINREGNANAIIDEVLDYFFSEESIVLQRKIETIPKDIQLKYQGYYCFKSPKRDLFGFSDRMLAGIQLNFLKDSVIVSGLLGKYKATLHYAGDNLFYRDKEGIPSVVLLGSENGKPAVWFNENYTEMESRATRIFLNFAIWLSMLLPFIFFLSSAIWMLKQVFSKSKKPIKNHLILWSACLCYILMFLSFSLVMENRVTSGNFNFNSMLFFISSIFLVVFSVWAFYRGFKIKKRGFPKVYFRIHSIAVIVISIFFLYNGFIGLRLWAY